MKLRLHGKFLAVGCLMALLGFGLRAATVSGTVKGPDGAAFMGAFVQAQNTPDAYHVHRAVGQRGALPRRPGSAGEYRVSIRALGFRADAQSGVKLTASQNGSLDFALQKGTVRWNDLSIAQASKLWPAGPGKDKIFSTCFTCHGFQTRMASVTRDADGWLDRVNFMRTAMKFGLDGSVSDEQASMIAGYLTQLYGPDSTLPKSPADLPEYKDTVRPFSSEAMNIHFVEYEMPGPSRMPFSAYPGKEGYFWIPEFGDANKLGRLDPKTGVVDEYPVPNVGTAGIHSAAEAPDGTVWMAEQGSNKLAMWDPKTQKMTEYQDRINPAKRAYAAGSKHTVRFTADSTPWFSGDPFGKFDRKTGEFTDVAEVPSSYDVKPDKDGNVWFTKLSIPYGFGKIDCQDDEGVDVVSARQERLPAAARDCPGWHRVVGRIPRWEDDALRSEDGGAEGISAARSTADPLSARHR